MRGLPNVYFILVLWWLALTATLFCKDNFGPNVAILYRSRNNQSYTGPIDARPPPAYVPLILSTNSMSFIILSISKFILCATTM